MNEQKLTSKDALKILAITGLVASSLIFPNIAIAYHMISKEWKKYKRGDIGRIIKRFHKQELIALREKDGEILIELSEKGKKKIFQYNFDEIFLKKKRDGKLRMLIFDIPDKKKLQRDIFRQKLKQLNFIQVQKSTFLCPYPCKKEIEFIVNYLEISKYIILFELGKIELGTSFEFKPSLN